MCFDPPLFPNEPPPKRRKGFKRTGEAVADYECVEHSMAALTKHNKWIKEDRHGGILSDFFAHIVAASYSSPELCARTPEGYKFLDCEFPHPNVEARGRTQTAKDIAAALGPALKHQIFGLIVFRYYNSPGLRQ